MEIRRYLLSEIQIDEIEPLIRDSFFASPGFLNLWRVRGGVPMYWTVWRDDALLAALPGVEFGKGILKRFHSTPNGCYGKMCFCGGLGEDVKSKSTDLVLSAIGRAGYIKAFINDFYGCFKGGRQFSAKPHRTRLVDISAADWEPRSKQVRKDIRSAEGAGLDLLTFDREKHFSGFLRLVRLSGERLGVSQKYPREFYSAMADLARRDSRVQWVWCEYKGAPVASSIFLVEGEHLLSWQIYFDSSYSRLQATKLVRFKTANRLARQGVRYLNLGVSHEGAKGTEEFKRRWGGDEFEYTTYEKKSLLGRLL